MKYINIHTCMAMVYNVVQIIILSIVLIISSYLCVLNIDIYNIIEYKFKLI